MRVEQFDFDLPETAIADRPASPRDTARLLCVGKDGSLRDTVFSDLSEHLRSGDLLVFNNTRVIPAQLEGFRDDVRIELTLHRELGPGRWRAFAKPARRLHQGDRIEFAEGFAATLVAPREGPEVELDFAMDEATFREGLARHGLLPLPPYIRRRRAVDDRDREDYQTVYAERNGAVAAPTAGLHFTPALLQALSERGIECATVTLHVGAGTFLPMSADDTDDHVMHAEWGEITAATAEKINRTRKNGGRVVAVGTTSLRLLESAVAADGEIGAFSGETDIFIVPGYRFRAVDMLITNFHLPKSTLFMLVCAFAGTDVMRAAYDHAIATGYRFYSYGDSSLLQRAEM
jgi:S-adenosylmethionine:tRNA ribosyltransferase-isomerase